MQSVVGAQTAVELIVRLGHAAVHGDGNAKGSKQGDNVSALESPLFEWTKERGFGRPAGLTQLRNTRNAIAHWGSVPSDKDLLRHIDVGRRVVVGVAKAVWDVDIDRLADVDLVSSIEWQIYLRNADGLLRDPDFRALRDDGFPMGDKVDKLGQEPRRLLAVGLARKVWDATIDAVGWEPPKGIGSNGPLGKDAQWCWKEMKAIGLGLRQDALALALGVPLPTVRRFRQVNYVPVGRFDDQLVVTWQGERAPSPAAARDAVDLVIDWVLRVEQHLWDADHAPVSPNTTPAS